MSEDIKAPAGYAELRFRDPAGQSQTWTVRQQGDLAILGEGILSQQVSWNGTHAVKRWIPAEQAARRRGMCDRLENEARAGMRAAERFRDRYPVELTRLVGYDLDAAEPFLLVSPPRGTPVAELDWMSLDERHAFQASLFRALLLLAEAGIVHGNVTATTVRWDGKAVQLGDFGYAAAVGDDRQPRPDYVEGAPEQRRGSGRVTAVDDVWAAGAVLLRVATGQTGPPDLSGRGAALRSLLDGVFAASADDRPSAATLLRRLGVDAAVPPADLAARRAFADGERSFDRALKDKAPRPSPPTVRPPDKPARRFHIGATGLIGLLVFAASIVLIVLIATGKLG